MISNTAVNKKTNYNKFNTSYNRSKNILFEAVKKDEDSKKEDKVAKREVMELYKKGIRECEVALKVQASHIPSTKLDEVMRHQSSVRKNMSLAKDRLKTLEELFSVGTSGKTNGGMKTTKIPDSRTGVVFPINKPGTTVRCKVNVGGEQRTVGRTKLSKSALLKGVDEKFGAPLLDEILDLTDVRMVEVQGAECAKKALEEAVIFPALNPRLFSGLRQPAQGILLFGPPGNGKTMLARAVATECGSSVFLNVSAAILTSKWVGDSEKLIRALFQIARNGQPSIIFIDEIDSMLCERNEKETEVSRRIKTEFLVQMDGMSSSKNDRVLVIGATNHPYELDTAVLRRFPKRILIDIPDEKARAGLIMSLLNRHKATYQLSDSEIREIAERTKGYSNSDLVNLCKEAAMVSVRELSRNQLENVKETEIRPIIVSDFFISLNAIKPSANSQLMKKLREFAEKTGQSA